MIIIAAVFTISLFGFTGLYGMGIIEAAFLVGGIFGVSLFMENRLLSPAFKRYMVDQNGVLAWGVAWLGLAFVIYKFVPLATAQQIQAAGLAYVGMFVLFSMAIVLACPLVTVAAMVVDRFGLLPPSAAPVRGGGTKAKDPVKEPAQNWPEMDFDANRFRRTPPAVMPPEPVLHIIPAKDRNPTPQSWPDGPKTLH
jgi:hypothetical protein